MRIAGVALVAALAASLATPLAAQEIKLPVNLDKLAAKAVESVDITLDGAMLRLAGRFLSGKNEDQSRARNLISGLESISVRSFTFAGAGEYSAADVDAVRAQVQSAPWGRVVGVKEKNGDNVEVYFKDGGEGKLAGIVLIAAEPKELTVVSVVGAIDPSQLGELGGEFGIPKLDVDVHLSGKKSGK
ncbi:MAG: DUF4252 domain-containing protein [Bryobacteraceae bacterium]|jgi:hypothetical protein